jgi:hypothetical protein
MFFINAQNLFGNLLLSSLNLAEIHSFHKCNPMALWYMFLKFNDLVPLPILSSD